ncbi:hypothetical protein JCM11641_002629 [Rhodosporidiobolus odoratus]
MSTSTTTNFEAASHPAHRPIETTYRPDLSFFDLLKGTYHISCNVMKLLATRIGDFAVHEVQRFNQTRYERLEQLGDAMEELMGRVMDCGEEVAWEE